MGPDPHDPDLLADRRVPLMLVDTFKGGVAKTTTALWTAQSFASLGLRTLLVGLSAQNDVVAVPVTRLTGLRDALSSGSAPRVLELSERLWHLPAGSAMPGLEDPGAAALIRSTAASVDAECIVVDGTAFADPLSFWVLDDADVLVAPMTPHAEPYAAAIKASIAVGRMYRDRVVAVKVLLTIVPPPSDRSAATKEILTWVREAYPGLVLDHAIRRTARVDRVALDPRQQIQRGRPTGSFLSSDYHDVARELLGLVGLEPAPLLSSIRSETS
ncbi:MAG: ParA family protein [Acidimicrobiales bacterium]